MSKRLFDPANDGFTPTLRKAMQLANSEAQRFNHYYLSTEHILLGLVAEGTGVASHVLWNLGLDLATIRIEVERLIICGPEESAMGKLPRTPRAKRVIEHAMEEVEHMHHNYIGTEHVLLGLLRETDGVAARVLGSLGIELAGVRREVHKVLESASNK